MLEAAAVDQYVEGKHGYQNDLDDGFCALGKTFHYFRDYRVHLFGEVGVLNLGLDLIGLHPLRYRAVVPLQKIVPLALDILPSLFAGDLFDLGGEWRDYELAALP